MDIVKQLREAHWADARAYAAADEIERLREALKIFADNVKKTNMGIDKNWAETVYPLKTENQQLRQRVELLEGYLNGALNIVENLAHCDTTDARKALKGE
jgi:hypothetical protein